VRLLTIGFLHLGDPRGGVHRYGRMLADELRSFPDVEVVEREALAATGGVRGIASIGRAVAPLRRADVTIVPYGPHHLWAPGLARLLQLFATHVALRCRTIAVLHDVRPRSGMRRREALAQLLNRLLARRTVVHSAHERERLSWIAGSRGILVIPHFVESRSLPARDSARRRLGVAPDVTLLGMLGWIHPRKNATAAIEALSRLDRPARLWLIGAVPVGAAHYRDELERRARGLGVEDEVEITGYVTDEEMDLRLAAVDVALCPYTDVSASGSLATLIASGRPVVATDLPAVRDQRQHAGSRLSLVAQPTPELLATAVRRLVDEPPDEEATAAGAGADVSPRASAQRYFDVARTVARRGRAQGAFATMARRLLSGTPHPTKGPRAPALETHEPPRVHPRRPAAPGDAAAPAVLHGGSSPVDRAASGERAGAPEP
jgi:glycosyltransferase involved in cell wall biosynthesis